MTGENKEKDDKAWEVAKAQIWIASIVAILLCVAVVYYFGALAGVVTGVISIVVINEMIRSAVRRYMFRVGKG
ncbi:MAG: hypothetical protein ABL973_18525 [Micropepsaceae bacterium]